MSEPYPTDEMRQVAAHSVQRRRRMWLTFVAALMVLRTVGVFEWGWMAMLLAVIAAYLVAEVVANAHIPGDLERLRRDGKL